MNSVVMLSRPGINSQMNAEKMAEALIATGGCFGAKQIPYLDEMTNPLLQPNNEDNLRSYKDPSEDYCLITKAPRKNLRPLIDEMFDCGYNVVTDIFKYRTGIEMQKKQCYENKAVKELEDEDQERVLEDIYDVIIVTMKTEDRHDNLLQKLDELGAKSSMNFISGSYKGITYAHYHVQLSTENTRRLVPELLSKHYGFAAIRRGMTLRCLERCIKVIVEYNPERCHYFVREYSVPELRDIYHPIHLRLEDEKLYIEEETLKQRKIIQREFDMSDDSSATEIINEMKQYRKIQTVKLINVILDSPIVKTLLTCIQQLNLECNVLCLESSFYSESDAILLLNLISDTKAKHVMMFGIDMLSLDIPVFMLRALDISERLSSFDFSDMDLELNHILALHAVVHKGNQISWSFADSSKYDAKAQPLMSSPQVNYDSWKIPNGVNLSDCMFLIDKEMNLTLRSATEEELQISNELINLVNQRWNRCLKRVCDAVNTGTA